MRRRLLVVFQFQRSEKAHGKLECQQALSVYNRQSAFVKAGTEGDERSLVAPRFCAPGNSAEPNRRSKTYSRGRPVEHERSIQPDTSKLVAILEAPNPPVY